MYEGVSRCDTGDMPTQIPFEGPMLGAALTVVGLIISWVVWRRKGAASGLRAIAWSLLPRAAGLLGLMGILVGLVGDLVRFFTNLVFSPIAWAGVAVASIAVMLWVIGGLMRARGAGTRAGPETKEAPAGTTPAARASTAKPVSGKPASGGTDDFDDIEALLRKRGIS